MARKYIFQEEYYVKVYQLARTGIIASKIAESLGIPFSVYIRWKREHPALKKAELDGKNIYSDTQRGAGAVEKFHETVYQQLPTGLKELWDIINETDRNEYGVQRIENLLKDKGKRAHQQLFIYALTVYNFNYNRACVSAHVSKRKLDIWKNTDPDFADLLESIRWHQKNYYEGALLDLVARGDGPAILMVNRSFNGDRGYNTSMNVNVNGKVEHEHKHVHVVVDDLNLPIDTRKEILVALRKQKVIESNGHEVTSIQ